MTSAFEARVITCGTDEPPQKFWAVCGLAPRDRTYDGAWYPTGSGTLVRWTDGEEVDHLGIVRARHFISSGGSAGDCVQTDNWYAYFYKCADPPPWPPPAFECISIPGGCEVDGVVRVRVTCFTMASGSFFGTDCVLVGEIEEEDIECLDQVTPMIVASPYDLEVCREQPVYIAGWGRTYDEECELVEARSLHVASNTIDYINCEMNGRNSQIALHAGSCVENGACLPYYNFHDSGGAIAVGMMDGSLRLVGVLIGLGGEFIAARHQFFSDPSGTEYLCQPCRPAPCVDVAGDPETPHGAYTGPDGKVNSSDYTVYALISPYAVNCGCLLDINQDGYAANAPDLSWLAANSSFYPSRMCDRFQWCYGDANLDGRVNQDDEDFVEERLNTSCLCASCPGILHWCQGDLNCDGAIDEDDLSIIASVRSLELDGDVACADVSIGCTPP
ncbi:MAG: hypothetical protein JNK58_06970 [Phycisphaerae bacterium]|nr:hypothetical protein [Phycisphaerae bacterium]